MDSVTRDDPRSRYIALAAVIALHLLLLQIAQRISGLVHRVQYEVDDALVLLQLDRPEPPPEPTPRVEETPPERLADVRAHSTAPASTREAQQQAQAPATPLPPRQIDWRSNAARSAQLAAEAAGQERYRSFGPRKDPAPGEPQASSVFAPPPKHTLGDIGGDAADDPVVWLNENCYTELDKRVQTARDWITAGPGQFAPPKTRCFFDIGSAPADGTLLEHIKKKEEPPVPKAGTEMNELPERIEEPRR